MAAIPDMSESTGAAGGDTRRVQPLAVLQDGLVAGLLGAFAVALVHLVADAAAGAPLRTPTILGRVVFGGLGPEGAQPDVAMAFWFTCVHIGVWVAAGTFGSWLISLVDAHPRLLAAVFGAFAFGFITLLYATGAFQIPGLPPLHLWTGTLVGSAAAAAYLLFRHPHLAAHVEREGLTPTTVAELLRALRHERQVVEAYESAARQHPLPLLARILAEKRARVQTLEALTEQLDLVRRAPHDDGLHLTAGCQHGLLRAAVELERRTLELYDELLVATPELDIRNVFLRLRYQVADGALPQLEAAVRDDR